MPSPLAHSAAGYLVYRLCKPNLPPGRGRLWSVPLPLIFISGLSLLPDIDVVPGTLFGDLGRYHNNLTHSLIVGLAVALICWLAFRLLRRSYQRAWFVAALLSYNLHVVLDLFTGDRGVMLFWPLTSMRFSAPVKLFIGVQWGNGLVSVWHLYTILTEALVILAVALAWSALLRWRRPKATAPDASFTPAGRLNRPEEKQP